MKNTLIPFPKLQPSANIALVCPGSLLVNNLVTKVAEHLSKHYGFNVTYQEDTQQNLPAEKRAQIFLNHLFNENIDVIWAIRGGEGTADLLPFIDVHASKIAQLKPKILIGLSDFTAMLVYFSQKYHWPVVHGPGASQFLVNEYITNVAGECEKQTVNLLLNKVNELTLNDLIPLNQIAKQKQVIEGTLTGGNLSLIHISIKDIWELDTRDKIVIIEDVAEKAHKISRTLKHLQRIKLFAHAKAIILGDFLCKPIGTNKEEQMTQVIAVQKALDLFAQSCAFPVLSSKKIGHGHINYPVVFNMPAQLVLNHDKAELKVSLSF